MTLTVISARLVIGSATLPCVISAPSVPGYEVTGVCGRGGFAVVYRAWQQAIGREVAVKIDNRALLTERDQRRFLREVTAAGRLSGHPNVIDAYDAGTLPDGRPYLVMELCPAGSLQDEISRDGPMAPARVRDIGTGLADALAAAHQAGVLHRDIKPANVLVNRYGQAGLSDFGLASLLDGTPGQSVTREALTPAYAPPEAFRACEPSAAADVYSLAATLYALLAGAPPHVTPGEQVPAPVMFMMRRDQPPDDIPGAPPQLMAVLRDGLAVNPADRPPSAAALRDALIACARAGAGHGVPPGREAVTAPSIQPRSGQTFPAVESRRRSGAAPRRRLSPRTVLGLVLGAAAIAAASIAGVLASQHSPGLPAAGSSGGTAATGRPAGQGARLVPGVYGVPVVARHCPAARVTGGEARCPVSPECWNGLVEISGNVTAEPLPCTGPHVFQTFAIGILPAEAQTWSVAVVQADPAVTRTCSQQVLLQTRRVAARRYPASAWRAEVMPPDETQFDSGARYYRCVAYLIGTEPASSLFGS